jgi:hypothetical protein
MLGRCAVADRFYGTMYRPARQMVLCGLADVPGAMMHDVRKLLRTTEWGRLEPLSLKRSGELHFARRLPQHDRIDVGVPAIQDQRCTVDE